MEILGGGQKMEISDLLNCSNRLNMCVVSDLNI